MTKMIDFKILKHKAEERKKYYESKGLPKSEIYTIIAKELEVYRSMVYYRLDEEAKEKKRLKYLVRKREYKTVKDFPKKVNLETKLKEIPLSYRSFRIFKKSDIKTIGELIQKTPEDLLRYHGFGMKSLGEIKRLLVRYDMKLKS